MDLEADDCDFIEEEPFEDATGAYDDKDEEEDDEPDFEKLYEDEENFFNTKEKKPVYNSAGLDISDFVN